MIPDELLEEWADNPTVNDVVRLVREVRRQRREIAHLRGALAKVGSGAVSGHGPHWVEEQANLALEKDFRLE